MVPPAQLSFNLQSLLEQLNPEEWCQFKSLLRALYPQDRLQQFPLSEVEEASRKQLVDILTTSCPHSWVEMVAIQIFDKMNRADLSQRAQEELRELTQEQDKDVTNPEVKESLEGEKPGKQDKLKSVVKTFWKLWRQSSGPGVSSGEFTERDKLKAFCGPKTLPGPFPHTVVLLGAAGVGKTTLAKKWMFNWMQGDLPETPRCAFYLSCKQLNHRGLCTFPELIASRAPEVQEAEMQAQGQNVLFVIDGFDELRVPSRSLIHDFCADWKKQEPVPVLLGSLLKRKLLPNATLLVTTRPGALRELLALAQLPIFLEEEGLSEPGRRAYFLDRFREENRALRALEAMKSNPALFRMGAAPAVCQIVCACLSRQMEEGQDPAATCRTSTSLFLRFLCGQFEAAPACGPIRHLPFVLCAVCRLAAQGMWAQTSLLDREDLQGLGLTESDLCPFLDKNILQEDSDCGRCYAFVHLSVQQFLAAVFYVLDLDGGVYGDRGGCRWDIGDVQALLSKEERLKNPDLTLVGYFLFGLVNEQRARELETTFGCRVSAGVKQELLASLSFCSAGDTREALRRLYESQEEPLVKEAMVQAREVSVHLRDELDLLHASFCLRQAQNLQKMSLRVGRGVFLEEASASEIPTQVERSQKEEHRLSLWRDLCTVFHSSSNLAYLDITQSFLSTSALGILCDKVTSVPCHLQKVSLRNISPADAYRNLCLPLGGYETLTHLTLEGNNQEDMLPTLCAALRHPKCNLQYLRVLSCSATAQQWAELTSCLETNQSLLCLNLTAVDLEDEGAKLLFWTLRHPKCFLQRLSLENCHLTRAYCKELSSALVVNQGLTHLCLAKNDLGDSGVKLLCEGLSHPDCQLQTLVLYYCNITWDGCISLSMLLQQNSRLEHLDLGLNHIGITGLKFLCEALKKPLCSLRCLWLWGCAITPLSCADLSSALSSNRNLVTLDLGQNFLGQSGLKMLSNVLKLPSCPLQKLRLKIDRSNAQVQKLLKEIKEHNPKLTIERDDLEPKNTRPSSCDFIF